MTTGLRFGRAVSAPRHRDSATARQRDSGTYFFLLLGVAVGVALVGLDDLLFVTEGPLGVPLFVETDAPPPTVTTLEPV
jgi:hypothetical protein